MQRIHQCLNAQLTQICQQAVRTNTLNIIVSQFLPENLRTHCSVGSFNKGCLVLVTKQAEWASQLRYYLPELRDRLRKEAGLYKLGSIKITLLLTEEINRQKTHNTPLTLSSSARNTIRTTASRCTYLPLKEALLRLANRI